MKNPQKFMTFVILFLLVSFIVFTLTVKQKTETGQRVGYFLKTDEADTVPVTPVIETTTA